MPAAVIRELGRFQPHARRSVAGRERERGCRRQFHQRTITIANIRAGEPDRGVPDGEHAFSSRDHVRAANITDREAIEPRRRGDEAERVARKHVAACARRSRGRSQGRSSRAGSPRGKRWALPRANAHRAADEDQQHPATAIAFPRISCAAGEDAWWEYEQPAIRRGELADQAGGMSGRGRDSVVGVRFHRGNTPRSADGRVSSEMMGVMIRRRRRHDGAILRAWLTGQASRRGPVRRR